jgi:hypothetical protein
MHQAESSKAQKGSFTFRRRDASAAFSAKAAPMRGKWSQFRCARHATDVLLPPAPHITSFSILGCCGERPRGSDVHLRRIHKIEPKHARVELTLGLSQLSNFTCELKV